MSNLSIEQHLLNKPKTKIHIHMSSPKYKNKPHRTSLDKQFQISIQAKKYTNCKRTSTSIHITVQDI